MKQVIAILLGLTLVTGCAYDSARQNETSGTLIGAAVGGLVGSQIGGGTGRLAATAAGAVLGGMIGGNVGRSMDDVDRLKTSRALEHSRTGHTTAWRNPDTHREYAVTPTKTYTTGRNQYCREFTMQGAKIGGRSERVYGTACRQPDGTWKMQ